MVEVESSKQLQHALKTTSEQWAIERAELAELQSQIHFNVAADVPKFEKLLKEHKKKINERMKARKQTLSNNSPDALLGKQTLDSTEENLNNALTEFEYVRIRYLKDKFERLLKAQVAYHAKVRLNIVTLLIILSFPN